MVGEMSVLHEDQLREVQGGSFLGMLATISALAYMAGRTAGYLTNDESETAQETTIEECYCTCQCSA